MLNMDKGSITVLKDLQKFVSFHKEWTHLHQLYSTLLLAQWAFTTSVSNHTVSLLRLRSDLHLAYTHRCKVE